MLARAAAAAARRRRRAGHSALEGAPVQGALIAASAPAGTVALTLDGRDGAARRGRPLPARLRPRRAAERRARRPPRRRPRAAPRRLRVAPRAWPIQHVGMARPAGGPTPEYQRLREGELAADRRGAGAAFAEPGLGAALHLAGAGADQRPVRVAAHLSRRRPRRLSQRRRPRRRRRRARWWRRPTASSRSRRRRASASRAISSSSTTAWG